MVSSLLLASYAASLVHGLPQFEQQWLYHAEEYPYIKLSIFLLPKHFHAAGFSDYFHILIVLSYKHLQLSDHFLRPVVLFPAHSQVGVVRFSDHFHLPIPVLFSEHFRLAVVGFSGDHFHLSIFVFFSKISVHPPRKHSIAGH